MYTEKIKKIKNNNMMITKHETIVNKLKKKQLARYSSWLSSPNDFNKFRLI